jgi:hypothetical protein
MYNNITVCGPCLSTSLYPSIALVGVLPLAPYHYPPDRLKRLVTSTATGDSSNKTHTPLASVLMGGPRRHVLRVVPPSPVLRVVPPARWIPGMLGTGGGWGRRDWRSSDSLRTIRKVALSPPGSSSRSAPADGSPPPLPLSSPDPPPRECGLWQQFCQEVPQPLLPI